MSENHKREKTDLSRDRVRSHAIVFFALHLEEAYIGRLLKLLQAYTKMRYHQNLPQILFYLLEIGGRDLFGVYGNLYKRELQVLQQRFVPGFVEYLKPDARPSVYDEPQN